MANEQHGGRVTVPAPPKGSQALSRKPQELSSEEKAAQAQSLEQIGATLAANPDILTAALEAADPRTLDALRKKMGAAPVTRKRRRKNANQDARNFTRAYGDATHEPGFEPTPPDWVTERDKENPGFKEAWLDRWRDGLSVSALTNELDEDELLNTVQM